MVETPTDTAKESEAAAAGNEACEWDTVHSFLNRY